MLQNSKVEAEYQLAPIALTALGRYFQKSKLNLWNLQITTNTCKLVRNFFVCFFLLPTSIPPLLSDFVLNYFFLFDSIWHKSIAVTCCINCRVPVLLVKYAYKCFILCRFQWNTLKVWLEETLDWKFTICGWWVVTMFKMPEIGQSSFGFSWYIYLFNISKISIGNILP